MAPSGWSSRAPYDVIIVSGGLPVLPHTLLDQLKIGGRLAAMVGDAPAMTAQIVTRICDTGLRHAAAVRDQREAPAQCVAPVEPSGSDEVALGCASSPPGWPTSGRAAAVAARRARAVGIRRSAGSRALNCVPMQALPRKTGRALDPARDRSSASAISADAACRWRCSCEARVRERLQPRRRRRCLGAPGRPDDADLLNVKGREKNDEPSPGLLALRPIAAAMTSAAVITLAISQQAAARAFARQPTRARSAAGATRPSQRPVADLSRSTRQRSAYAAGALPAAGCTGARATGPLRAAAQRD